MCWYCMQNVCHQIMSKLECLCGLVVWFLLRVQEVPISIIGRGHLFYLDHRITHFIRVLCSNRVLLVVGSNASVRVSFDMCSTWGSLDVVQSHLSIWRTETISIICAGIYLRFLCVSLAIYHWFKSLYPDMWVAYICHVETIELFMNRSRVSRRHPDKMSWSESILLEKFAHVNVFNSEQRQ